MLSPFDLPAGILLLVTDQLSSPADFMLYRAVFAHLKAARSEKVTKAIVLSVSPDRARWAAVAAKSNIQLDQKSTTGAFNFVDVLSHKSEPDLPDVLVVVDELATLEWTGSPVLDITCFCRALAATCRKANATLLIRQHVLTPSTTEPILEDLFRTLHHMCTYHMEVLPLSSGRSGAVSGQVTLHIGPGTVRAGVKLFPRSSAIHYKLADTGALGVL
ncbi:hypothetical protein R3P38DRAFT_2930100 [Favolaschia claudopus]|uniref:Elongator complex protein 6 n=1 Tax=Favolaschia claudopus TaxID=2862362 RepID=A0AAW0BXA3_9AGAR